MRIRDTAGGRVRGPVVGAGGRMYPAGGWPAAGCIRPAAGCIRPAAGYPSCPDARLGHQRSAMDWSKKETVENRRKTPQRHRARAQGPVATDAEGSGSARTRIAAAMCNRLNSFPMRPRPAAAGAGPTASCGCGCHGAGPLVWPHPAAAAATGRVPWCGEDPGPGACCDTKTVLFQFLDGHSAWCGCGDGLAGPHGSGADVAVERGEQW